MSQPPISPKIYHITHVANLPAIVAAGMLESDSRINMAGGPAQTIGMSVIKQRRVERIEVDCHPGTKVGEYVPFYFCPRSVMLFVIYKQNHPDLTYRGGQSPIVHLEADLHAVVRWANDRNCRWAFSLSNAGALYTAFRAQVEELNQLDWHAIEARDFRQPHVAESKQAEFLLYDRFPLDLVERIGVRSAGIQEQASLAFGERRGPTIEVRPEWYF